MRGLIAALCLLALVGRSEAEQINVTPAGGAPSGAAGGVLSGTYPNPGMAAGAAATNLGAAGGGLTGSYPSPTVATVPASAMPAFTGDCTTSAGAVATTCTKTSGTAFGSYATISSGSLTNSLSGNVALNNTANFFDGPIVAQGSVGTWVAIGTVTLVDTVTAKFNCKLDIATATTSPFASASGQNSGVSTPTSITLAGVITSPAGNIRISCQDVTSVNGNILSNTTGVNKDSTLTVYRIN